VLALNCCLQVTLAGGRQAVNQEAKEEGAGTPEDAAADQTRRHPGQCENQSKPRPMSQFRPRGVRRTEIDWMSSK
jgi:hypothetical protein